MKQKRLLIAGTTLFCALALLMTAIWYFNRPETESGSKHITVEVVHGDGTDAEFTYQTDMEYLGELLQTEGLISGTDSAYGLYVDTVDGETADYPVNCSWWHLACDGEEAQTGADSVVLHDGATYTWTYTIS